VSNDNDNKPNPDELDLPELDDLESGGLEDLDLPETEAGDPLSDLGEPDLPDSAGLDELSESLSEVDEAAEEAPVETEALDSTAEEGDEAPLEDFGPSPTESDEDVAQDQDEEEAERKAGLGLPGLAVFGFCGLSVLTLLALDVMVFLKWGFLFFLLMNVFWLMATAIPFIMWMGRKTLNFYEVVLGISLAGIIIAVALLLAEVEDYKGEITPKGGGAARAYDGADSTRAIA